MTEWLCERCGALAVTESQVEMTATVKPEQATEPPRCASAWSVETGQGTRISFCVLAEDSREHVTAMHAWAHKDRDGRRFTTD